MNKKMALYLSLALTLTTSYLNPGSAYASDVNMKVGNQALSFVFAQPFIEDGRTLTPLRDLLVGLGITNDEAHIIWDKDKQSVTAIKDSIQIELTVGNKVIYKNGKQYAELDVPAKLVGDRVFIPARIVAEALGHKVVYEAPTKTVLIDPKTIVYTDLNKLVSVVQETLPKINVKTNGQLDNLANDSLEYLKLIDQKQLVQALYESYNKERKEVLDFIEQHYMSKLGVFFELAVDTKSPSAYRIALPDLIASLPTDPLVDQLEIIMKTHPNDDVRYTTSFYLYKFPSTRTMKIFESILPNEQADNVFVNAAASYQTIGRTMPVAYVSSLFTSYMNASEKQRDKYKSYLLLNVRNHDSTKEAWNTLLTEKSKSKVEQEQKTAQELLSLK